MCKGMELHDLDVKIVNTVDVLREMGIAEADILECVAKKFNVTVEYVKELMMPKAV